MPLHIRFLTLLPTVFTFPPLVKHLLQLLQPDQDGNLQGWRLHLPASHLFAPHLTCLYCSPGHLRVRLLVPPPQDLEHSDQDNHWLQMPSKTQCFGSQALCSLALPTHSLKINANFYKTQNPILNPINKSP